MENDERITDHYNKQKALNLDERNQSNILNIRNMHNFIKSILIQKYIRPNCSVLDLGCGKGGDLKKFSAQKIKCYYGIDIAENSITEAKKRHEKMNAHYTADFEANDAYNREFNLERKFDLISSQFSLHYAFQTEDSFNRTISNIDLHLNSKGYFIATIPNINTLMRRYKNNGNGFGNDFYKVTFTETYKEIVSNNKQFGNVYNFYLLEAIDNCVEYLVNFNLLIDAFKERGIELIEHTTFLDFYNNNYNLNLDLHNKIIKKRLSIDELKVIELYSVIAFKKN
ncbi:mRNA cap guanine-N7 methyltransferase [Conglomerata obtusa]